MSIDHLPRLEIHLLGAPQVRCGGLDGARHMPVKAQALLYYLAATGQTHTRAALAHILWSEHGDAEARSNLRKGIQELREHFGAYLAIDYHSVGFVSSQIYWVDAAEFGAGASEPCAADPDRFEAALALYRADFLDGFHVRDAPEYEDWLLGERARLRELAVQGLLGLAEYRAAEGDLAQAIATMRRLLELEPWREDAHRQLMIWLAQSGQRNTALLQYEVCRRVLADELGVEPEKATRELHCQLLRPEPAAPPARRQLTDVEYVLVGRQVEREALERAWATTIQSGAQMVLIAGEAGIGKTRLAEELLVHVQRQGHATARARAYALEGRLAYAPLAEWLRSAPLQGRLAKLDRVWLREVSRVVPELLSQFPDLPAPEPLTERWQQKRLLEALRHAFKCEPGPQLLLLDDLQWCDAETLACIQYLCETAPDSRLERLLIVGTVRSDEVLEDHPLHQMRRALVQAGKLSVLDLAPLSAEDTTVLGSQVNKRALADQTAAYLYQTTAGNPLFIVETMRAKQQVLADPDAKLPPKIHAVIDARLAQLSPAAYALAQVAAVIGRAFTLPLLVAASGEDEEVAVHGLDELWRRRIIQAQGEARYDFTHDRIRDVAYAAGSPVKRAHYHRRVAQALERLHAGDLNPVAGELGMHYQHAGAWAEALACFRLAAGVARRLYAHGEEVDYLQKAIASVQLLPGDSTTAAEEIELWLDLGSAQSRVHDWGNELVAAAWQKADALAAERGLLRYRSRAMEMLAPVLGTRGQWHQARALDELALSFVHKIGDKELIDRKTAKLGVTIFHFGDFTQALALLERQLAVAGSPEALARAWLDDRISSTMYINMAQSIWLLGFPDQALAYGSALLSVCHRQANFSMRCAGLGLVGMFYSFLRDASTVQVVGEGLAAFCSDNDYPWYAMTGHLLRGWAIAQQGNAKEGLPLVRMGVDEERRRNIRDFEPHYRSLLAETLALAGSWEEALDEVTDVLVYAEECGNCFWNAHLFKLKGDFMQALSYSTQEVEACYQQAINMARRQGAKTLELRATTNLARLWQGQERLVEARQALAEVYSCFTEGFGTADLLDAKALLEKL